MSGDESRMRGVLYGLNPWISTYEVEGVLARMRAAKSMAPDVRPGESVRVIAGTFLGQEGTLLETRVEQEIVRVELVVAGKPTVVDLGFKEIEPAR